MNIISELTRYRYNIGFIFSDSDSDFIYHESYCNNIKWLDWNGYKGGWFADPFILSVNESFIEVLVEEWVDKQNKGRISKLVIDKTTSKLLHVIPLLENNTHFSFPNIWRDSNDILIYPENYQSGGLFIYKYDKDKDTLSSPICLIDEPLLDAQILQYNDAYYIFGVRQDNGAEQCKLLYIYKSTNLLGEYTCIQTIKNPLKEERGAGAIFICDNKIIRPAQSCEVDYGHSMVFYELYFRNGKFEEKKIGRLLPNPKQKWSRKIHTYNRYENLVVVDGNEFVHSHLSTLYRKTIKKYI